MGASPRVLRSAIVLSVCAWAFAGWAPAQAQFYEASLRTLGYAPDPLARSPRLLAMGRLSLADDLHNRITLWEFAGSPTGIADAETLSTLEYRPATQSSSGMRDLVSGSPGRERQELAASHMTQGIETWRRARGTTAYGLTADVATLQVDRPYSGTVERRGKFIVPALSGAVNGRLPWVPGDRFDYALRLRYAREAQDDLYYQFFQLPQGEYLGKKSLAAAPPDYFSPNRIESNMLGGGVAISMRVSRGIRAALGYDRVRQEVEAKNEALRSTSRIDESRPIHIGQASLIARLGAHLEWGADGRAWRSRSEEFYFWSVSAGPAAEPLVGLGKRLDREETGTSLRTRARWSAGALDLGASFQSQFRRTVITPWYAPRPEDPPGFNDFLQGVAFRSGADTLSLPEPVRDSHVEERQHEVVGGASWRLPGRRGVLGAEVHHWRTNTNQRGVGIGPRPMGWDVRAGGEYRCSEAFLARAGWSYGLADRDDFTSGDTYRRVAATAGFGVQPAGSRWSVDLGYAYEWVYPDFVDPTHQRETHRRLAAQMRWPFGGGT